MDQVIGSDPVNSRGLYPDNSKYLNYAVYSLHQLKLDAWQLSFGGRFNSFRIKVADEVLGNVSVKPQALVGNASVSYLLHENSNFYTSFHSGFRAPNIDDMGTLGIVDFRYELPAYDLKPETSYNFEAGYKYRSGGLAIGAALFQNNLRNLITRVKVEGQKINGIDVYRKENVERAYIRGGELEAEYVFGASWKVYGSGAYNFGKNVTRNEPVRRIPPLSGRIGVEYRKKGWYVRPEGWFADKQTRLAAGDAGDNRIPKGGTPGWAVVNLMAGYDARHFALNAVAQNMTNKDYRTHGSGINGVGRSLWLTLTGKF
jgi:hemoglobin/transferrin/lactoferrin receptor protein